MPVLGIIFLRHAANRFEAATRQIAEDQANGKFPKRKIIAADYVKRAPSASSRSAAGQLGFPIDAEAEEAGWIGGFHGKLLRCGVGLVVIMRTMQPAPEKERFASPLFLMKFKILPIFPAFLLMIVAGGMGPLSAQ